MSYKFSVGVAKTITSVAPIEMELAEHPLYAGAFGPCDRCSKDATVRYTGTERGVRLRCDEHADKIIPDGAQKKGEGSS